MIWQIDDWCVNVTETCFYFFLFTVILFIKTIFIIIDLRCNNKSKKISWLEKITDLIIAQKSYIIVSNTCFNNSILHMASFQNFIPFNWCILLYIYAMVRYNCLTNCNLKQHQVFAMFVHLQELMKNEKLVFKRSFYNKV